MKRIVIGIFLTAISVGVICQEADSTVQRLSGKQKRAEKVKQGKFMAFPFAAPAYTPELGLTLMGAMMISFKTDPSDTLIQRSSTPLNIGVSTRGSYFFNSIISTFWLEAWKYTGPAGEKQVQPGGCSLFGPVFPG